MKTYQDAWTRYHDKPCKEGKPSSNNGWIYTAYAQKLRMPMDRNALYRCYVECCEGYPLRCIAMNRSPGKQEPPMSRDEILGLYWLGLLPIKKLIECKWNYCPYPVPRVNIFKTVAALYRMRNKHRNELWQNGGEPHLYWLPSVFTMPIQDRAYMLRDSGMPVPLFYAVWEWVSKKVSKRSDSGDLINWRKGYLKLDTATFTRYFGDSHPFCEHIRLGR